MYRLRMLAIGVLLALLVHGAWHATHQSVIDKPATELPVETIFAVLPAASQTQGSEESPTWDDSARLWDRYGY